MMRRAAAGAVLALVTATGTAVVTAPPPADAGACRVVKRERQIEYRELVEDVIEYAVIRVVTRRCANGDEVVTYSKPRHWRLAWWLIPNYCKGDK